jgi:hypothetical protein
MKKLFVIFAALALVWAFVGPAAAADWNFYGSARMATFYTSDDYGDFDLNGVSPAVDDDDDDGLQWTLQGNSRLGATVKGETVSGRVELAVSGDIHDVDVRSRRIFGTWNFGAGTLKVGKDYTPTNQFISSQAFGGDLGLLGIGTWYALRPSQIALSFGGFNIALIEPADADYWLTGDDVDSYFPKIEASWGMAFDQFNFNIMGGYQYFEIEDQTTGAATDDLDATSWVVGADAGFTFGPAYIRGAASLSQNPENAGWYNNSPYHWAGAVLNAAADDLEDTDMIMAALVAGFKMSDMVSFEAGFGWQNIDPDVNGFQDTTNWAAYANATIALAPGVWIIPEVGYFEWDRVTVKIPDDELGSQFYLGAKWQIDF